MAFVNEETLDGKWQSVDREKNAILKYEGSTGSGGPIAFTLETPDGNIRFTAGMGTKLSKDQKTEVFWHIKKVFYPDTIDIDQAYSLINESLDAFGATGNPDRARVAKVIVNFENVMS